MLPNCRNAVSRLATAAGPGAVPPRRSAEFSRILARNLVQLLLGTLDRGHARARRDLTEECFQPGWGHDPQEQQLAVGVLEAVPGILRDEDRAALVDRMRRVVEDERPSAI